MERRKAIAIAGTVGVSLAAASAAAFANVSLLSGAGATEGVGELDAQNVAGLVEEVPTSTTLEDLLATSPDSTVVYVDEYVTAPGGALPPAPGTTASGASVQADDGVLSVPAPADASVPAPASGAPAGGYDDDGYDDHGEDDQYEDEDHEEDEHEEDEGDEHEYEDDDD